MTRVAGWETVLADAVIEAQGRAFQWSVHDCVTFAFDVRYRLTGLDTAKQWRGRYRGFAGGLRCLRRLGHATFADLATAECGQPVPPLMAQRGDLVQVGEAMGVCLGGQVATMAETGLVLVPLTAAVAAWRV